MPIVSENADYNRGYAAGLLVYFSAAGSSLPIPTAADLSPEIIHAARVAESQIDAAIRAFVEETGWLVTKVYLPYLQSPSSDTLCDIRVSPHPL